MNQRDRWLQLLCKHLNGCGWICEAADEWGRADILVRGPGFHQVTLTSVYEEILHKGWHWVRFRLEAKRRPSHRLSLLALLAALVVIGLNPVLLPLLVPLSCVAMQLLRSRQHMINAISQAALECGAALEMPEVDPQFEI